MFILGCVATTILLNILNKKLFNYIEENAYDQNANSCSMLDYEIAEQLA